MVLSPFVLQRSWLLGVNRPSWCRNWSQLDDLRTQSPDGMTSAASASCAPGQKSLTDRLLQPCLRNHNIAEPGVELGPCV